jgi:hypothetical protein
MYHFLHKHRHWFLALIVIAVILIAYFQLRDDGGMPVGPVNQPNPQQPVAP